MTRRLTDHSVLTFDCYGTLIDWETGIWDAFQPLLAENPPTNLTRNALILAFNNLEARHQAAAPTMAYPAVLERVHRALAENLVLLTSPRLDYAFGASVPSWPAFPDSADALRFLSEHFGLVILSNVDRAGFAASNTLLGVEFDAIYTAEDIGSYKPDPSNFEYLIEHVKSDLGYGKSDILHTAQGIRHDHIPARSIGLDNAWIDRNHLSATGTADLPATDHLFLSMAEMAAAVAIELAP
jgi:2-haloalkanoic acid dehalogenase type II